MRIQIPGFLQQPRSGLRLVSVLLPLGEQREMIRCPIGPAGGMEGESPSRGESVRSTLSALSGSDMKV